MTTPVAAAATGTGRVRRSDDRYFRPSIYGTAPTTGITKKFMHQIFILYTITYIHNQSSKKHEYVLTIELLMTVNGRMRGN